MHESSMSRMRWIRDTYIHPNSTVLDVGSKSVLGGTYRELFADHNYTGLDIEEGENVDICISDPYEWHELNGRVFDVVISGQALEHIPYFWITVQLMTKAVKHGGLMCVIAPAVWPIHQYPVDCWRINKQGMEAIASYVGMEVLHASQNWCPKYADPRQWCDDEMQDSMLVARKV